MRRADRLFQIVQLIRGRRLTTAAWLAQRLEISERTVYRDVADLQRQGVPIEGEAGVGYRLGKGFDLPPLMFSNDEAQALVAAVRIAQTWLDPKLAVSSQDALSRVLSVLPAAARASAESLVVMVPPVGLEPGVQNVLQQLREAAQAKQFCEISYRDAAELRSQRRVRPLGVFYWGKVWTLGAWCESRHAFRNFRVDRIESLQVELAHFSDDAGKTLSDLLRFVEAEHP
ncbi:YafY family protein [Variovorax sp. PCZ-1]|uniref:helix-turn-helix transcriptional regulator n=1 Tax=Variovorax sp. PCZ-1 TaxID=2835533 RepID=UPI001BCBF779|nr:YafY family protein [Variovorax sp. PCZ-1]MBS7807755.1 YafY family transcriptional regulator [Variovorax sp. PCZ-1]